MNPAAATPAHAQALPRVVVQTELGHRGRDRHGRAPITAANSFVTWISGSIRFGRFYRTVRADNQPDSKVKISVVQAGLDSFRVKDFPPIKLERTNVTKLSHDDGTISMARDGPDTATSDFFICVGDQPALDYGGKRNPDGQGFAAFGRVLLGMDVVRKIQAAPAGGRRWSRRCGLKSYGGGVGGEARVIRSEGSQPRFNTR